MPVARTPSAFLARHPRRGLVLSALCASLALTACGLKPEVKDSLSAVGGGQQVTTGGGAPVDPGLGGTTGDGATTGLGAPGTTGTTGSTSGGSTTGTTGSTGSTSGSGGSTSGTSGSTTGSGPVVGGTTTGITKSIIYIGIHAPLSGASPLPQGSFESGAKKFWSGKKFFGRGVEVLIRDDKYTPSGAVRACEELARKAFVVLGAAGTDQIQACGRNRLLQKTNTPYISSGVTENGLRGIPNYFANSLTYKQQSPLVVANAKRAGFADDGKWALVLSDTPNFEDAKTSMEAELKRNGIPYDYIPVPKAGTDSDSVALASKLRAARYPVVYFLGQPFFFAKVVNQAQAGAYAPTWTGPGPSMGVNSILTLVCGAAGGFKANYLSPYHGLEKAPAGKYKDDIEMITAGSMAGVEYMLKQMQASSLNRETLLQKLHGGLKIPGGTFPPADYSRGQFAGTAVYSLVPNCNNHQWRTAAGPFSK